MATIISNRTPIDPHDPGYKAMLEDLQGNILKGHGRELVTLLLIDFTGSEQQQARTWIGAFGRGWVTSASQQSEQTIEYRNARASRNWRRYRGPRGDPFFANLLLSKRGYDYIGVPDERLPPDRRFKNGMRASRSSLKDSAASDWEPVYQRPIHAAVLLAASTEAELQRRVDTVVKSLSQLGATTHRQDGRALRDEGSGAGGRRYVEHFNYLDGRSQPLFSRQELRSEEDWDGTSDYDPFASLALALVKDPNGGDDGYGSYLVYRKLEQNVRGFKERVGKPEHGSSPAGSLADELGFQDEKDRRRVGAMVIGRLENGTPLALSGHANLRSAPNNFNYDDDGQGLKCPHFAHIRKVNPRTDDSRNHRIVRRGISYEDTQRVSPPSEKNFEKMPSSGVGLLFMCFQSNIEAQFEYLQRLANDDPELPGSGAGPDPLIGQGNKAQEWPTKWGADPSINKKKPARFGSFVTLKGGEYFFAPCRSFFEALNS